MVSKVKMVELGSLCCTQQLPLSSAQRPPEPSPQPRAVLSPPCSNRRGRWSKSLLYPTKREVPPSPLGLARSPSPQQDWSSRAPHNRIECTSLFLALAWSKASVNGR